MTAHGVNHATTASGNDNNGNDGGLPKLPVEWKLQNSGVLWELLRVLLAAERQLCWVLVIRNGSIEWRRREKRQLYPSKPPMRRHVLLTPLRQRPRSKASVSLMTP